MEVERARHPHEQTPVREVRLRAAQSRYGRSWTYLDRIGDQDGIKDPRFVSAPQYSLVTGSSADQIVSLANMVSMMERGTALVNAVARDCEQRPLV